MLYLTEVEGPPTLQYPKLFQSVRIQGNLNFVKPISKMSIKYRLNAQKYFIDTKIKSTPMAVGIPYISKKNRLFLIRTLIVTKRNMLCVCHNRRKKP